MKSKKSEDLNVKDSRKEESKSSLDFLYSLSEEDRLKLNEKQLNLIDNFYDLFLEYINKYKSNKAPDIKAYTIHSKELKQFYKLRNISSLDSYNEFLSVPINDVKIKKGKIIVDLHNAKVCLSEDNFCDSCFFLKTYHHLPFLDYVCFIKYIESENVSTKQISNILKILFNKSIRRLEHSIRKKGNITFNTYVSKNNFRWLYRDNKYFKFSIDSAGNPVWSILDKALDNPIVLTSEVFHFDKSYFNWALNKIKDSESLKTWNKDILINIFKCYQRNSFIQIIPKSCYKFYNVPDKYTDGNYMVTKFNESYSHASDVIYNTYEGAGKDFLIWSLKDDTDYIYMIPSKTKYSQMRFSIDLSYTSHFQAIYLISAFFSSTICNKRSDCNFREFFRAFEMSVTHPYYDYHEIFSLIDDLLSPLTDP